jgi:hypothetical protein
LVALSTRRKVARKLLTHASSVELLTIDGKRQPAGLALKIGSPGLFENNVPLRT